MIADTTARLRQEHHLMDFMQHLANLQFSLSDIEQGSSGIEPTVLQLHLLACDF